MKNILIVILTSIFWMPVYGEQIGWQTGLPETNVGNSAGWVTGNQEPKSGNNFNWDPKMGYDDVENIILEWPKIKPHENTIVPKEGCLEFTKNMNNLFDPVNFGGKLCPCITGKEPACFMGNTFGNLSKLKPCITGKEPSCFMGSTFGNPTQLNHAELLNSDETQLVIENNKDLSMALDLWNSLSKEEQDQLASRVDNGIYAHAAVRVGLVVLNAVVVAVTHTVSTYEKNGSSEKIDWNDELFDFKGYGEGDDWTQEIGINDTIGYPNQVGYRDLIGTPNKLGGRYTVARPNEVGWNDSVGNPNQVGYRDLIGTPNDATIGQHPIGSGLGYQIPDTSLDYKGY